MTKELHEGKLLKQYLWNKGTSQEEFATKMGYKTRQGLRYHFDKKVLDYEFKMQLRKKGILAFDENGKWIGDADNNNSQDKEGNPFNLIPADADIAEARKVFDKLAPLVSRYVESLLARVNDLNERVKLLQELGDLKDEKIRRLEIELNQRK